MRDKVISSVAILILMVPMLAIDGYGNAPDEDPCSEVEYDFDHHVNDQAGQLLSNAPRAFTANHGQLENDEVLFYDHQGAVWFTADGMWMEFRDYDESSSQVPAARFLGGIRTGNLGFEDRDSGLMNEHYKRVIIKQEFVGANEVRPLGRGRLSWNSNFFYGNISENWCTDVPNYAEVWYENIYDGIDLRYYTNDKGLKYDFIVHPGADLEQIKIRYAGANELRMDNSGDLIISTKIGDILDTGLYIYQENHGIRNAINGNIQLFTDLEYGFDIKGDYDRSKPIIIDPQIEFSTFFGGNSFEYPFGISVDSNDNSYLTGITNSIDFNSTPGAHDTVHNGQYADGYVIKFNQNGSALEYATFLGGLNWNYCRSIYVDKKGNAYIAGETNSSDFPMTNSSYDTTFNSGWDVFVTKLNYNGSQLVYSTFIGGGWHEDTWSIIVNENGSAHITGVTVSNDFPTTTKSYDKVLNGVSDVYVLKLDPNGSSLEFSTFLGGTKDENGYGLDIDQNDNVYITGITISDDFPTTPGAFDRTINSKPHQQSYDVFVSKLNSNGTQLLYSTFVGGWHNDYGKGIIVDQMCNAYVTGYTPSDDFPVTPGAYDITHNGGGDVGDAFAFKLNYNASSLIYSTFIGGNAWEFGLDIELDALNNAYVFGTTNSTNFPTTIDAYNRVLNGSYDTFICQLDNFGATLLYSTYFGGSSYEWGFCGTLDLNSNIYIAGYTTSQGFPTTPGAYNRTLGGVGGFLTKFSYDKHLNISYLEFLFKNKPTKIAYSQLRTYSFSTKIIDSNIPKDTKDQILLIDPGGLEIKLTWNSLNNTFTKSNDPNNYINIENTSNVYFFISFHIINFDVTFNWTFPHEEFMDVQAIVLGFVSRTVYLNVSNMFRVENDLVFNNSLCVKGEDCRLLDNNSMVRGGEYLNWTGPLPVYQGSDNIYVPEGECNVSVWDGSGNCWLADSIYNYTKMNNSYFNSYSITAKATNQQGELYTINLSGIPKKCDKTNLPFTIRIDGDNVTFNHLRPVENVWQKDNEVYVGIHIMDHGGGYVDNKSVIHSISIDSGITWSNWTGTLAYGFADNISVYDFVTFEDGSDNLIKWCAKDSLGNGPAESEPYRILVDTQPIFFNDPLPNSTAESAFENVSIGITIFDNTSGVNISSLKYSYSINSGITWSSWLTLVDVKNHSVISDTNGNTVKVSFNQTFPNGTGNRIRWRGYDIAGNGPAESEVYSIIVDLPKGLELPMVQLLTPENNSKIKSTPVKLTWHLVSSYNPDILFDIKLDTQNPPQKYLKQNHIDTSLNINSALINYQTYYWTVIPKLNGQNGTCYSGIWEFTMDLPIPQVRLKSPTNNSNISSIKPTFVWAVRYNGPEKLKYHFYIDTSPEFKQGHIQISETYYMPEYDLKLGKTYYWQVVPWAGELKGEASEVWRFTITLEYSDMPSFKLMLRLEPPILEIMPGQTKFVQAFVTNLGNSNDTVKLSVNSSQAVIISGSVYRQDTKELSHEGTGELMVMVSAPGDAKPGQDVLMIKITSKGAEQYGLTVQDEERLIVNIVSSSERDTKTEDDNFVKWLWTLIFLVIIIVSIILIVLKRKKDKSKEEGKKEGDGIEELEDVGVLELPMEATIISTSEPDLVPGVEDETVTIAESEPRDVSVIAPVDEDKIDKIHAEE
jgi:hypothetical protein